MCKSKMSVKASQPQPQSTSGSPRRTRPSLSPLPSSSSAAPSSSSATSSTLHTPTYLSSTTTTTSSSSSSLASLRLSLPQNPLIYDFSEIRSATNNFLAKPHSAPSSSSSSSSSTTSWRCSLRGKDVLIFQRKLRRPLPPSRLLHLLRHLSRTHLLSIVDLLGASLSSSTADDSRYIYLVYEFVPGASLSDCLRNPNKNLSNFTILSTWMSRMQIAADVAAGLDYIHNNTGLNMVLVHNHIKSSSILVTEPSLNAKICHFGTAQLCGEVDENPYVDPSSPPPSSSSIVAEERDKKPRTSGERSGRMQFEGARGYMSPEYLVTGVATQKSDVYAFGVVLLELLSGKEPFKYRYHKASGDFVRTSIVDTARGVLADDGGVEGRLRMWVDRRLSDSFPVEVGEKMVRLALECVESDPDKRPDMNRVAGKISKLYMQSKSWSDSVRPPTSFISVSLAPR